MASERLQKPVLVLNASYELIIVLCRTARPGAGAEGRASAEEADHGGSFRTKFGALPSVIRLLEYTAFRARHGRSRRNIRCATGTPASIAIAPCLPAT
jgi:hypothetical protein